MSNLIVTSPQRPYTFPDRFKAVSNGDVYAGLVDKTDLENPANQIQVYVVGEDGSETPVSQPLKINSGGLLVYNGQPSKFVVKQNYSMLVKQRGKQVFYEANMAFVDPEALVKYVDNSLNDVSESKVTTTGTTKSRALKDRFADIVNVKDFGAIGDGITDDTAAIQAAINHAESSKKLVVKLPEGLYLVDYLILNGSTLVGEENYTPDYVQGYPHQGGSIILVNNANVGIDIKSTSIWQLKNLRIQENDGANTHSLVTVGQADNGVRLDRVFLKGGQHNIRIRGSSVGKGLQVYNSYLTGASRSNFLCDTPSPDTDKLSLLIKDCLFDIGGQYGLIESSYKTAYVQLVDTYLESLATAGVPALYTQTNTVNDIVFTMERVDTEIPNGVSSVFTAPDNSLSPSIKIVGYNGAGLIPVNIYTQATNVNANVPYPKSSKADDIMYSYAGRRNIIIQRPPQDQFLTLGNNNETNRVLKNDGNIFYVRDTQQTTITNITGGYTGQEIKIVFSTDGWPNTTFSMSAGNIKGNKGSDWSVTGADAMLSLVNVGTADSNKWLATISE